jgi:hypothetical protein
LPDLAASRTFLAASPVGSRGGGGEGGRGGREERDGEERGGEGRRKGWRGRAGSRAEMVRKVFQEGGSR